MHAADTSASVFTLETYAGLFVTLVAVLAGRK